MKIEKISGESPKVYIDQDTHKIGGKVYLKDTNGAILDEMDIEPLKIIRSVYFIFYADSGEDFKNAAYTRKNEIEALDEFNYVFIYGFQDLWEIKKITDESLEKIKKYEMKKTREVSFFSHSSTDGVVGTKKTSKYSLYERTGFETDAFQMTLEGWAKINFNFDPENSIVGFYGCRGVTFAEKFMDIQNVTYAVSHGGRSADSEEYNEFTPSWFTFEDEKIYYLSPLDENEIAPMEIIKRGKPMWNRTVRNSILLTNISLDKDGNLYGWTKSGRKTIKREEITYIE